MGGNSIICHLNAAMAELVDALDSGSSRGNSVDVRLILAAKNSLMMFLRNPFNTLLFLAFSAICLAYQLESSENAHMKTSSTVALVANGVIDDYEKTAALVRAYKFIIAVDGGLNHLAKMHIKPDVIIGDFDSATNESLQLYSDVPIHRYPSDKDETDMELALQFALSQNPEKIYIYGALGKRPDHELANFHLLRRIPKKFSSKQKMRSFLLSINSLK